VSELLLKSFEESDKRNNYSQVENIVEDCLLSIVRNPYDIDKQYFLTIIYSAKRKPELFVKGKLYEVKLILKWVKLCNIFTSYCFHF
jgi:hypothetical protein